ncbi:hypothetical protein [Henriciella marina]|uniref:hypothetical protein n=1 Tax=Henriciella marina TaxID=453851 RepID=UPI00037642CA|nr:hypothetical protein [Henriciella marina]
MIIIVFIVGVIVFVTYGLINMPSKQARAIFDAQGPSPEGILDIDRAYVADLHDRFGASDFRLKAVRNKRLGADIAERFGVTRARLDDTQALGVRLPQLKLLVSFEPGRYRLTEDAARLAISQAERKQTLESKHHG